MCECPPSPPPSSSCLSKASGAISAHSQRQNVSKGQAVEPLCTNWTNDNTRKNRFSVTALLKSLWSDWLQGHGSLSSPQTEHRLKATIWQLDMPRQRCTLKNSRLPRSSPQHGSSSAVTFLSWWFESHLTDADAFPYPFLCVFVLLQKASATWQWTPTRLQCRCQTPTPGRQLWITWGCLPWE